MGVIYKPGDERRRRIKDKAIKDLDPSLREPLKKQIESNSGEEPKSKFIEHKGSKKPRNLKK